MELQDQVAVVTGAGRGIGKAISEALQRQGAQVVLAARSHDQVEAVARDLEDRGGRALAVPTDVTDPTQVQALWQRVIDDFGQVDILVNNAGTSYIASVVQSRDDEWWRVVDVNLRSCYLCSKVFVRSMIRRKAGRIINIGSIAGKVGGAYNSAYAASKAGVLGFTRSLALEVAATGITVNAVCPGYVDTQLADYTMGKRGEMRGISAAEYLAELEQQVPRRKHVTVEEVAATVLYLAGPAGSGLTGQAINVCGGVVMAC